MQVADNGTPPLSATQSFQVTVQTPARPVVFAPTVSGGMLALLVNGDSGPDYTLLGTTNLTPPASRRHFHRLCGSFGLAGSRLVPVLQ